MPYGLREAPCLCIYHIKNFQQEDIVLHYEKMISRQLFQTVAGVVVTCCRCLTACGSSPSTAAFLSTAKPSAAGSLLRLSSGDTIKIGVMLLALATFPFTARPLSTALPCLKQVNAICGINGKQIEILTEDEQVMLQAVNCFTKDRTRASPGGQSHHSDSHPIAGRCRRACADYNTPMVTAFPLPLIVTYDAET